MLYLSIVYYYGPNSISNRIWTRVLGKIWSNWKVISNKKHNNGNKDKNNWCVIWLISPKFVYWFDTIVDYIDRIACTHIRIHVRIKCVVVYWLTIHSPFYFTRTATCSRLEVTRSSDLTILGSKNNY